MSWIYEDIFSSYDSIVVKKYFETCKIGIEEDKPNHVTTDNSYYELLESLEESWDSEIDRIQEQIKEQRFADYLRSVAEMREEKRKSELALQTLKEVEPKSKVENWQVFDELVDNEYKKICSKLNSLLNEKETEKRHHFSEFGDCL